MAFVIGDRVKETSTTTGTGAITLLGAVSQFRAVSDVAADGDRFHYAIVGQTGTEWEVGVGVWNTGGTITRVATDVLSSSGGAGVLVSFSAGTKDVFITTPAHYAPMNNNRVINGDMRVDQRLPGFTLVGTSRHNPVDAFVSTNNTGTGSLTSDKSTIGNNNSMLLTAATGVTDLTTTKLLLGCQTRLEAQNVFDLNGETITISFLIETNWTGNLSVTLRNLLGAKTYMHNAPVVSGINNVSFSLDFEADTVTNNDNDVGLSLDIGTCNEGTYQTSTLDTWITGSFLTSTTSTQWAKTSSNFINITNVQLEKGPVASAFKKKSFAEELATCQRYYSKSYEITTPPGSITAAGATYQYSNGHTSLNHAIRAHTTFPVVMRAGPAITVYDQAGVAGKCTMAAGNGITAAVNTAGDRGFSTHGTNGVASTIRSMIYQYTADAEL